ncbi:MAG: molybdate ABC transporter substrate-binding protein [Syntrophales bacterium]|nr:molybdate ABC transporter substrate-binding protein [Syntrophales bacterium]
MIIEAWHADSLAGPMGQMKKTFEVKHTGITVNLTSGRSKELADRILKGEVCDVFAPSDPAVVKYLFGKKVDGRDAASWYVVFSANELVVITGKGNPLGLKKMTDMAKNGISLARVTGEKDMATHRTIEFIKRAASAEGKPDFAQKIIDGAVRENTIPDVLRVVCRGKADAGIVYLSAAVTVADDVDTIIFPATVNLSEQIRNVMTIPGTAKNMIAADSFVRFMLSAEGRQILKKTGQPPIVPPIKEGNVPFDLPVDLPAED